MKYYKEIDNYVSWISYQNPYPGKFDKSLIEPPGNTYQPLSRFQCNLATSFTAIWLVSLL